jgi:two-component system heavy metal sensor histidine kinase CusS
MLVSRLRLQLAARFATAVLVAVAIVDLGLLAYLWRDADQRLTRDLQASVMELSAAIRREATEPGITFAQAVYDALDEWPGDPTAFAVYAADGAPLGTRGPAPLLPYLGLPAGPAPTAVTTVRLDAEGGVRVVTAIDSQPPSVRIVAGRSTAELREYRELLAGWLLLSVPGVALFALLAGYWLAGRALAPMRDMARAIERIAPDDLHRRLPVRAPPDELGRLADRVNGLLERLAQARDRNRTFLAQAAHQIKTPLTLVMGESALGLERPRDNETYRATLERIRRAADQMTRRVDDLFLLAQAEAGDRPPIEDEVELDGLALECADLMRGRAQQTRHVLELARVDAAVARGNEPLLREALLELIENAIRYGDVAQPIRVSACAEHGRAELTVTSAGPALPDDLLTAPPPRDRTGGLGLSIVRWIARAHGGTLSCAHVDGTNEFRLRWPA